MKTKLYSYIRFSSMKQADGSSYERQKRTAAEIAAKYDLELVTSYQDLVYLHSKGLTVEQVHYLAFWMRLVDPFRLVAGWLWKT